VRRALLLEFRERLDQRVAAQGINLRRLARELRTLLAVPQPRRLAVRRGGGPHRRPAAGAPGHLADREAAVPPGPLAARRRRLPGEPAGRLLGLDEEQRRGRRHPGRHPLRAFEMAGVRSELLGFTTGAWNGGRPHREWLAAGSPPAPGRLNEACHMVFKPLDRPWRRARAGIAALLKADLFREGIDGEAVDWACERLLAQRGAPPHPDRDFRRLPQRRRDAPRQRCLLPRQPPQARWWRGASSRARSRCSAWASASTSAPSTAAAWRLIYPPRWTTRCSTKSCN
jgi:cobaltochelatase CobT